MPSPLVGTSLIDAVILATLFEWALLALLWQRRRSGLPPAALAAMLVPGLCLMLAVRGALLGMPWYAMALLLSAAGLVHLADLRRRWIRGPGDNQGD